MFGNFGNRNPNLNSYAFGPGPQNNFFGNPSQSSAWGMTPNPNSFNNNLNTGPLPFGRSQS